MRIPAAFLITALLLCGCHGPHRQEPMPVVTAITVTDTTAKPAVVMEFVTDTQTSQVLNYLRLLDFRGTAQVNPEYVAGPMYEFKLTYSDSSCSRLWQKADRYFLTENGQWQEIAPYSGSRLTRMLEPWRR